MSAFFVIFFIIVAGRTILKCLEKILTNICYVSQVALLLIGFRICYAILYDRNYEWFMVILAYILMLVLMSILSLIQVCLCSYAFCRKNILSIIFFFGISIAFLGLTIILLIVLVSYASNGGFPVFALESLWNINDMYKYLFTLYIDTRYEALFNTQLISIFSIGWILVIILAVPTLGLQKLFSPEKESEAKEVQSELSECNS